MHDHRKGHLGKSSKDRNHQKNATTYDEEGGTEVDRPTGFSERVHLTLSEEVTPFLQGVEGLQKFSLGSPTKQSLRRIETVPREPRHNDKPFAWSVALVIHRNFKLRGECGISRRENGRRHLEAVTNPLRIRSLKRIEVALL